MFLEHNQAKKAENTRNMILKVCDKESIVYCDKCEGTGLKDFKMGGHWGGEYCDSCSGVGLRGEKIIPPSYFLCTYCNGFGCKECDQKGYVDWITEIRQKFFKKKK